MEKKKNKIKKWIKSAGGLSSGVEADCDDNGDEDSDSCQ